MTVRLTWLRMCYRNAEILSDLDQVFVIGSISNENLFHDLKNKN